MDDLECPDTRPIPDEVREELLDPFIVAACTTLAEMALTAAEVRETYATVTSRSVGDITVVLDLTPARGAMLVLGFPEPTAAALAGRVLAETGGGADDALVRDCMGEITNVIAGQAKAMLHGTSRRFAFSTPRIMSGRNLVPEHSTGCEFLVAHFDSDAGDFILQVCSAQGEAGDGVAHG